LRAAPADISAPGPAQPGHNSAGLGQLNQAMVPSDIQQLNPFAAKWLKLPIFDHDGLRRPNPSLPCVNTG
jgi:hypothetical protein